MVVLMGDGRPVGGRCRSGCHALTVFGKVCLREHGNCPGHCLPKTVKQWHPAEDGTCMAPWDITVVVRKSFGFLTTAPERV